jgi:hypothetical protein
MCDEGVNVVFVGAVVGAVVGGCCESSDGQTAGRRSADGR